MDGIDAQPSRFLPVSRGLRLPPAAIGCDPLIRQPQPLRRNTRLPEHINRNTPSRIPVAADAQPARLHLIAKTLANADGHVFMKTAVIAERTEEQFQALRFHDGLFRSVINHQMRKVWLAGYRA